LLLVAGAIGAGLYYAGFVDELQASPAPALLDSLSELGDLVLGASVNADANAAAFLAMIGGCEGAYYDSLFGDGRSFGGAANTFNDFSDHPRIPVTRTVRVNGARTALTSSAAGRYQILAGTWDDFVGAVGARDFSPASQDDCALWLIRRRGALADVKAGRFESAIAKCAKEWASLPGSPYGQPVKTLAQVRALYQGAGGAYA
jgi:lysozyme